MNDYDIAKRYVRKAEYAKEKGHVFTLTFAQYKRIITTKHCRYTGIELTTKGEREGVYTPSFCTLDRVDNTLGYVPGNVVACCYAYNQFKAVVENPANTVDFKMLCRAINVQKKLQKKIKVIKSGLIDERNKTARTSYNFSAVKGK